VHFALVILEMEVSWSICLCWLQTTILPISASQVARITGMSHLHEAMASLKADNTKNWWECRVIETLIYCW
jgi:hypothetical protein